MKFAAPAAAILVAAVLGGVAGGIAVLPHSTDVMPAPSTPATVSVQHVADDPTTAPTPKPARKKETTKVTTTNSTPADTTADDPAPAQLDPAPVKDETPAPAPKAADPVVVQTPDPAPGAPSVPAVGDACTGDNYVKNAHGATMYCKAGAWALVPSTKPSGTGSDSDEVPVDMTPRADVDGGVN